METCECAGCGNESLRRGPCCGIARQFFYAFWLRLCKKGRYFFYLILNLPLKRNKKAIFKNGDGLPRWNWWSEKKRIWGKQFAFLNSHCPGFRKEKAGPGLRRAFAGMLLRDGSKISFWACAATTFCALDNICAMTPQKRNLLFVRWIFYWLGLN